ncbi:MAG: hypothetical protein JWQ89_1058 [Devosia sp.]|uniref:glycosyltransferase n=1 Tax=Devosia sp. TaxID=1871048 RepID=UPI00260919A2|nr:glycosyltransferase [Devosia sp.]MDB5539331.1 hypothetical protein [Devosia sp.]
MTPELQYDTVEFVAASRLPATAAADSLLARSLRRIVGESVGARIASGNSAGLPEIYNKAIDTSSADILVFVHDDIWIDDYFVPQRVVEALRRFDVIGVAGNTVCRPEHTKWRHRDDRALSGNVAHGELGNSRVARFGPTPAACELLDGVFLAARRARLVDAGVRFDERFQFHHYDLDFCRTARRAGLTLGTWPLSVTHASVGNYASEAWKASAEVYLEKWEGREAQASA